MKVTISKIDFKVNWAEIWVDVATDLIAEIKRLISEGYNTDNEKFIPKKDGTIPDFNDTGLLLKSLDFKLTGEGFELYIGDSSRQVVAIQLNKRNNWTFFKASEYLDNFVTKSIDVHLQKQFDNIK